MAATPNTKATDDAQRGMEQIFTNLTTGGVGLLTAFAKSQAERAARLAAAQEAVAKEAGPADPQVADLEAEKVRSQKFSAGLENVLQRAKVLPQPAGGQQSFAGTVQTADGAPAQGVAVRLTSTVKNTVKKVAETKTNQFGDYVLNVPLCEFAAAGDVAPEYHVVAEDTAGQTSSNELVIVDTAKGVIEAVALTLAPEKPKSGSGAT
jgi:hypothetical protein